MLREERPALRADAGEELLKREELLHQQMNAKDHQRLLMVQSEALADELAQVEKERRALSRQYDELQEQRRAAIAPPAPSPPVSAADMQRLLDRDTLLLVYSLGADRSFLWRVSPEKIEAFVLPPGAEIETQAREVYTWLKTSDRRGDPRPGREAAARLSSTLLGQVTDSLGGRRLVIVPAGSLHYIPFGALPIPEDPDGRPLMQNHEIITLPSASVLDVLRRRAGEREPASRPLAVIADPIFGRSDQRLETVAEDHQTADPQQQKLDPPPRLAASATEAEKILELLPPAERVSAVGLEANRQALMDGEFSDFRILHLAVHGELDDEQPEFSHLVLSLFDENGRPADGRLYLHEIDELDLPAELIVLSACNTALGKSVDGEGLISMTRGFMYAGASRVLVSLWYVDDQATAELMAKFYEELLSKGRSPAAALRAAQIAMQRSTKWHAPYFWAGFVLQGDWSWKGP